MVGGIRQSAVSYKQDIFLLLFIKVAILSSLDQLRVLNCVIENIHATGSRKFFRRGPHFGQPCFKVTCCLVNQSLFQVPKVWGQQHLERTLK
jgi:hypothetical protein